MYGHVAFHFNTLRDHPQQVHIFTSRRSRRCSWPDSQVYCCQSLDLMARCIGRPADAGCVAMPPALALTQSSSSSSLLFSWLLELSGCAKPQLRIVAASASTSSVVCAAERLMRNLQSLDDLCQNRVKEPASPHFVRHHSARLVTRAAAAHSDSVDLPRHKLVAAPASDITKGAWRALSQCSRRRTVGGAGRPGRSTGCQQQEPSNWHRLRGLNNGPESAGADIPSLTGKCRRARSEA